MSTAEKHRKRRCFLLWTPLAGLGAAAYVYSLTFTLTANGLSILGLIILSIGAAAAIKESRKES
ncbi:hypothetical protein [Brevibacterium sp. ZH18]|uniref:hypothetical protein n=1 Tax=Brevibacterium sp. ZH18 TaxID=2927784 RepID=UPI001F621C0C|nr:hypothetical protein [Brevibacterium sp. ZH18]MCI4012344.1 hypothetical protein [Brevibacterium sp. ZH18]